MYIADMPQHSVSYVTLYLLKKGTDFCNEGVTLLYNNGRYRKVCLRH